MPPDVGSDGLLHTFPYGILVAHGEAVRVPGDRLEAGPLERARILQSGRTSNSAESYPSFPHVIADRLRQGVQTCLSLVLLEVAPFRNQWSKILHPKPARRREKDPNRTPPAVNVRQDRRRLAAL